MKLPLVLLSLFLSVSLNADAQVSFVPMYGGQTVTENKLLMAADSSRLRVELMKGYISQVVFVKNGKATEEKNSYHLVDFLSGDPVQFNLPFAPYDSVYFTMGIDSAVQVKGVMDGDLDPSQNMYWTWQSGYIHLKLEGVSIPAIGKERAFQYHIGGYRFPDNTCRSFGFPYKPGMKIGVDMQRLLSNMTGFPAEIMSPGPAATRFADLLQQCFYLLRQ